MKRSPGVLFTQRSFNLSDQNLVFWNNHLAGPVFLIYEKNSCLDQDSKQFYASKAGDPGSNPSPGENFSLKLTTVFSFFSSFRVIHTFSFHVVSSFSLLIICPLDFAPE